MQARYAGSALVEGHGVLVLLCLLGAASHFFHSGYWHLRN
jgi:hypothetical protein